MEGPNGLGGVLAVGSVRSGEERQVLTARRDRLCRMRLWLRITNALREARVEHIEISGRAENSKDGAWRVGEFARAALQRCHRQSSETIKGQRGRFLCNL